MNYFETVKMNAYIPNWDTPVVVMVGPYLLDVEHQTAEAPASRVIITNLSLNMNAAGNWECLDTSYKPHFYHAGSQRPLALDKQSNLLAEVIKGINHWWRSEGNTELRERHELYSLQAAHGMAVGRVKAAQKAIEAAQEEYNAAFLKALTANENLMSWLAAHPHVRV